jgi:hypothetical protein
MAAMRTYASFAALLVATLAAGSTFAQADPRKGQVTIAVERLFGFHTWHTEIEGRPDSDSTAFGLMWARSETAFHQPRAAIDFFLTDGLSLGGSVAYYSWSGDTDRNGFLLYPRVGYGMGLGQSVTFWPRGGITYFSEEAPGGNPKYDQVAMSFEAMFVLWPRRDWGIQIAPTLDLGLSGKAGDDDFQQRAFGVTFGLLGSL